MTDCDPVTTYERLKIETAAMLNLDVDSASLLENLQVDLVSLLRLQVDDLQGRAMNGEQVDLNRLSTALTMLQKLLPVNSLTAPAPGGGHDFSDAKAELSAFLAQRADALERRDSRERDEIAAREEMAAIAAATIDLGNKSPQSGGIYFRR
jgi:hypothetical protein